MANPDGPEVFCLLAVPALAHAEAWEAALFAGRHEIFRTRAGLDHPVTGDPDVAMNHLRSELGRQVARLLAPVIIPEQKTPPVSA
ncbi:MAG TPA: hypothetical protein VHE83_19605 [Mycobacteriales bacterium]|nr:hypothetical protein [Mycobacteriales bacterium]